MNKLIQIPKNNFEKINKSFLTVSGNQDSCLETGQFLFHQFSENLTIKNVLSQTS